MIIHIVQPSETITFIADTYSVDEARLIRDNGLMNAGNLVPGQAIVIVYPEQEYIVQEGDSLLEIANTYDVSVMQL